MRNPSYVMRVVHTTTCTYDGCLRAAVYILLTGSADGEIVEIDCAQVCQEHADELESLFDAAEAFERDGAPT